MATSTWGAISGAVGSVWDGITNATSGGAVTTSTFAVDQQIAAGQAMHAHTVQPGTQIPVQQYGNTVNINGQQLQQQSANTYTYTGNLGGATLATASWDPADEPLNIKSKIDSVMDDIIKGL